MAAGQRIPIWLDADTGHDDAFAILLAARHPSINLLGISTTFSNAPLSQTTHNTLAILKAIGREDVPVYSGAAKPFCREAWHAPEIHGSTGLDGTSCLPEPSVGVREGGVGEAVKAMHAALMGTEKGTAWLVATGALTNAAMLFASYPSLAQHLGGLSIMGGAIGSRFTNAPMGTVEGEGERFGNWTPYAEFNIYIDPESAKSVLSKVVLASKTTLVPLDLTHLFLATQDVQQGLRYGFDRQATPTEDEQISIVRTLFLEILTFFSETYARVFGLTAGPPLHDPLAVAAVLMPDVFDDGGGERYAVEVVTDGAHGPKGMAEGEGSECGRTKARKVGAGEGVRIPRGLDKAKVWRVLEECLARAEEATMEVER